MLRKEHAKFLNDKIIIETNFVSAKKCFCMSPASIFSQKSYGRWIGPYVVVKTFPHGAVEIRDSTKDQVFKVHEYRLKHMLELLSEEDVSVFHEAPLSM